MVMECVKADSRKLPPYIILKRKNMPKIETFPSDGMVRVQQKERMTSGLMLDWIEVVWKQRPGTSLGTPEGMKSMLMLDAFRSQLNPEVKKSRRCNCDLVVVLGGITPVLQPLDVSINKPFKANLRQVYEGWIRNPDQKRTPTGRLQKASASTVAMWTSDASKRVPRTRSRGEFIQKMMHRQPFGQVRGRRPVGHQEQCKRHLEHWHRGLAVEYAQRQRVSVVDNKWAVTLFYLLEFLCIIYFCIAVT